jgi:hypothetical protein
MSWLKLDDRFAQHPKLTQLSRSDRWTWVEILCYCARYETDGFVPETLKEAVPKASADYLNRAYELGLLDLTSDGEESLFRIHDWTVYNPRDPLKSERQARWRRRKRDGDVDAPVDGGVDVSGDAPVDADVDTPRAARARGPSRPKSSAPLSAGEDLGGDHNTSSSDATLNGASPPTSKLHPDLIAGARHWIETEGHLLDRAVLGYRLYADFGITEEPAFNELMAVAAAIWEADE